MLENAVHPIYVKFLSVAVYPFLSSCPRITYMHICPYIYLSFPVYLALSTRPCLSSPSLFTSLKYMSLSIYPRLSVCLSVPPVYNPCLSSLDKMSPCICVDLSVPVCLSLFSRPCLYVPIDSDFLFLFLLMLASGNPSPMFYLLTPPPFSWLYPRHTSLSWHPMCIVTLHRGLVFSFLILFAVA